MITLYNSWILDINCEFFDSVSFFMIVSSLQYHVPLCFWSQCLLRDLVYQHGSVDISFSVYMLSLVQDAISFTVTQRGNIFQSFVLYERRDCSSVNLNITAIILDILKIANVFVQGICYISIIRSLVVVYSMVDQEFDHIDISLFQHVPISGVSSHSFYVIIMWRTHYGMWWVWPNGGGASYMHLLRM